MELVFDEKPATSSFVEIIWQSHSDRAGTFTSVATSNWEMVFTTLNGRTSITARGPETKASTADYPADADFFGITFKLGTFMPHLPIKTLCDRQDASLSEVSGNSFWLYGSTWEIPTFDNADVFISRLIRQDILVHDPLVEAAIQGDTSDLSIRALQYRFLQVTGLTHKTIQQIDRAHHAVSLLEQGVSVLDTASKLGYFDQAHLTHSLKRFIGQTPAQVARRQVLK